VTDKPIGELELLRKPQRLLAEGDFVGQKLRIYALELRVLWI
jgi:hypothetical protein